MIGNDQPFLKKAIFLAFIAFAVIFIFSMIHGVIINIPANLFCGIPIAIYLIGVFLAAISKFKGE